MDTVDNTACGSESSNHGTCNTNTYTLMDVEYIVILKMTTLPLHVI